MIRINKKQIISEIRPILASGLLYKIILSDGKFFCALENVCIQRLDLCLELRYLTWNGRTRMVIIEFLQLCLQFTNSYVNGFLLGSLNLIDFFVNVFLLYVDPCLIAFVHFCCFFLY